MSVEAIVQDSMGGLPDFDNYELTWGVSVDLSADSVERLMEN
jgi:hypothetical protein